MVSGLTTGTSHAESSPVVSYHDRGTQEPTPDRLEAAIPSSHVPDEARLCRRRKGTTHDTPRLTGTARDWWLRSSRFTCPRHRLTEYLQSVVSPPIALRGC